MGKKKVLTREQLRNRRAKPGEPTTGESRNTPEVVALLLKTTRSHWTPYPEFIAAFDEVIDYAKQAHWSAAIVSAFEAGRIYAAAELGLDVQSARRAMQGSGNGLNALKAKTLAAAEITKAEYLKHKVGRVSHTAAMRRTEEELKIHFTTVRSHLKLLGITGNKPKK